MANRNIERAVRIALLAAGAAGLGVHSTSALAQTDEIEQVIVTGSRIPQPNIEGTSPVTVVGSKDIEIQGAQQVTDFTNKLPQVFAAQGSNVSNGASGTSTIDLRGLGSNRTLVLVNGRRMPAGSPTGPVAPDVNAIPPSLIKRVEVLTGGASAVYGADAVAGVVNFIMEDSFEGVQIDGTYGGYYHNNHDNHMQKLVESRGYAKAPGSVFDGDQYSLGITLGSNFADGKGNATIYMGYMSADAILESERDYSACTLGAGDTCSGSSTSYPGRFTSLDGAWSGSRTMDPTTGVIRPYTAAFSYNFGPLNYYQRPSERWLADAFVHYDLNDSAQVYGEFMFMDNNSVSQIAPSGIFFGSTYTVSCANPLLQQNGAQWYNAFGCTAPDAAQTHDLLIGRRNVEGGGRQSNIGLTSFRGVVGVKGTMFDNWNYDVSAQYGKVLLSQWYGRDFSITRLNRALNVVDDGNGNAVCASVLDGTDPACVPYNIWAIGGVTQEAINYLQIPLFSNGNTNQTVVSASVSSDLGQYGLTLPTAQSGVSIALGAEYRQEGLDYNVDANYASGDGAGQGGPTLPVAGSYNTTDVFGELRVPLVQDMSFAKDLQFSASYRYSSYSTDTDTNTYGLGLDWQIIDDVKLRGSFQHAVRAPNIIELYSAAGKGLFNWDQDPCGPNLDTGGGPTASLQECLASGLLASQYGSDLLFNPAGQYNGYFGGNPDLKPEKADTWTVGVVFTPTFLDGFSLTLDYWNIQVDDAIASVPPDVSVDQCLAGSSAACANVQRDPTTGSLWTGSGQVIATNVNIGTIKTSGWDVNALYALTMGDWGGLNFSLVGTYLDTYEEQPVPPGVSYECAGFYGNTCGVPAPTWRSTFRTTWSTPWSVDLSLTWRYYGSVDVDLSSNDTDLCPPDGNGGCDPNGYNHKFKTLDAMNYIDLAAIYTFAEKYTLNVGINNLFDEDPPLTPYQGAPYGNGNTYPQVYDAMGRYVFAGLTVKF
ncbi:MAG: TonB-dependent receptor [Steroidobacteraceae bacterium]